MATQVKNATTEIPTLVSFEEGLASHSTGQYPHELASRAIDLSELRRTMDPLETISASPEAQERLARTLLVGVGACEEALHRAGAHDTLTNATAMMQLDAAYALARADSNNGKREAMSLTSKAIEKLGKTDFTPESSFDDDAATRLFTATSAKAMRIHLRSALAHEELEGEKLEQSEILSRRMLGGLIKQSVGQLEMMSDWYNTSAVRGKEKSELSGRLFELLVFTHQLTKWYRSDDLSTRQVRFALDREDEPHIGFPNPKHSFDVVTINQGQTPELRQLKGVDRGDEYASEITMVTRNLKPQRLAESSPQIVAAFQTLLDQGATGQELSSAWRSLNQQFTEKKTPKVS
jgi:hypothetical protein